MKKITNNNLFDENIIIDSKLFETLQIKDIVSWSHIILQCTIRNIEVNFEFFKGILCATPFINTFYNAIFDAIQNTNFLDEFIDNEETIKIIEKIYTKNVYLKTESYIDIWGNILLQQNCSNESIVNYEYNFNLKKDSTKKYDLLNAIFLKNQFSVVKFYNKYKTIIHNKDIDFERWLVKSFYSVKEKSPLHNKIFNALQAEVKKQTNLSMFLN